MSMCCGGLDITCAKPRCNQKEMKTLLNSGQTCLKRSFDDQAVKNFSQYGIK